MAFKKGVCPNPGGRPKTGYQSISDRMKHWLEKYTVEETLEIAQDAKQIKKLPSVDYMVVMRITEAYKSGGGQSMDRVLDRAYGKPKETIENLGSTSTGVNFGGKITVELVPAKISDEPIPPKKNENPDT